MCWLEGGNAVQGCGYNSWLYSCCMKGSAPQQPSSKFSQLSKRKRHDDERNVQKKLSKRRYDTSEAHLVTQPNCGIPRTPSNTLQKRIIGGRPAYFAGEKMWFVN